MNRGQQHPPGRGHAWRGDWKQRLADLLAKQGASSVTEFANTFPAATMGELVSRLGPGDVAPVQLEWTLLEEARQSGAIEHAARRLLVSEIRETLPQGWPVGTDYDTCVWPVIKALSAWTTSVGDEFNESALRVAEYLRQPGAVSSGWLPSGPDDPILIDVFRKSLGSCP